VPELWLPLSACQLFEQTFNLTYDSTSGLYLLSAAQHQALLASNPNITLTVSHSPGDGKTVSISFPYAAFDLTAKSPYQGIGSDMSYFPLRRAVNDTQYTLGKVFLQEAYLIVDWERGNFSVSQCLWQSNSQPNIVSISAKNATATGSGGGSGMNSAIAGLGTGAIAGIIVAIVAVAVLATALAFFLCQRRKRRRREIKKKEEEGGQVAAQVGERTTVIAEPPDNVIPKVELDASDEATLRVRDSYYKPALVEAPTQDIFELPGDQPKSSEADGRQLTEKEVLQVRENRYNGMAAAAAATAAAVQSPISPVSPGSHTYSSNANSDSSGPQISPVSPADTQGSSKRVQSGKKRKKTLLSAVDVMPLPRSPRRVALAESESPT
jgi:hypothetical protein